VRPVKKLRYTFKTDILFKMLFVKNPDLLKGLVAALLGIQLNDIEQFIVHNPEIPPEAIGDKFCRLDINMIVNGQRVDIEVQVENKGDYRERILYYGAMDLSASLTAGQPYSTLPRTVIISIVDFTLFDCAEYHSHFQLLETTRHTPMTDKLAFHFFELPKLPANVGEDDMLLLWLSLFKANTEEDLTKIKALEVPTMNRAIDAYYTITASTEFQELERLRNKADHDEAQALYHAEQLGEQRGAYRRNVEVAKSLLKIGLPLDQIAEVSGLTLADIKELRR